MIQNSIFTSKRIDEQNGSLHQHKSTFVVIDYYQGFKPPFLRLILREFKGKNRGRFGWTTLVRSSTLLNLISSFKNINFLKQIIVSERKFLTMNFSFKVILSSFKNNSLF